MKKRNGFVSNSSNTSFCIMGIRIEEYKWEYETKGLDFHRGWLDDDGGYLGISVIKMDDRETKAEFKERVRMALYNLGLNVIIEDIGIHEGGYYDG